MCDNFFFFLRNHLDGEKYTVALFRIETYTRNITISWGLSENKSTLNVHTSWNRPNNFF